MMKLSKDIWDASSILSEEEKDLGVLIPLMKLTREFLTTVGRS